ncbi:hypothetical protein LPLAFNJD_LOCUS1868 [Methylorubrum aminovorans]
MQVIGIKIPAVRRVIPKRQGSDCGSFSEVFRAGILFKHRIANAYMQL